MTAYLNSIAGPVWQFVGVFGSILAAVVMLLIFIGVAVCILSCLGMAFFEVLNNVVFSYWKKR